MDRWGFMFVCIFTFSVLSYCKVVAETVELKVYSNSSNVIVQLVTPGNNQNQKITNQGLKTLKSGFNPNISQENPLIILVPQNIGFREFLSWNVYNTEVSGFCIEVFKAALQDLGPDAFPYKFVPFKGSYNDLIKEIHDNETIGGAVGDITMLASRSKLVDFTAPYMESGIAMIVLGKDETRSVWMVFRPFSKEIWSAIIGTLLYTGFVVWFLEHGENSEFRGPWPQQFVTTVWFIFSTLFFAHRERITSGYSRIVIVVWLFLILVMVSSFQASLSSMLTVPKIPSDIDYLLRNGKKIGMTRNTVIWEFLISKNFKGEDVAILEDEIELVQKLREQLIDAAFIEIPYLNIFLEKYSYNLKIAKQLDGVGLAFAFRKGSPYTSHISKAILNLMETNKITELEQSKLHKSSENWNPSTTIRESSLTIDSFGFFLSFLPALLP